MPDELLPEGNKVHPPAVDAQKTARNTTTSAVFRAYSFTQSKEPTHTALSRKTFSRQFLVLSCEKTKKPTRLPERRPVFSPATLSSPAGRKSPSAQYVVPEKAVPKSRERQTALFNTGESRCATVPYVRGGQKNHRACPPAHTPRNADRVPPAPVSSDTEPSALCGSHGRSAPAHRQSSCRRGHEARRRRNRADIP